MVWSDILQLLEVRERENELKLYLGGFSLELFPEYKRC